MSGETLKASFIYCSVLVEPGDGNDPVSNTIQCTLVIATRLKVDVANVSLYFEVLIIVYQILVSPYSCFARSITICSSSLALQRSRCYAAFLKYFTFSRDCSPACLSCPINCMQKRNSRFRTGASAARNRIRRLGRQFPVLVTIAWGHLSALHQFNEADFVERCWLISYVEDVEYAQLISTRPGALRDGHAARRPVASGVCKPLQRR